MEGRWHLESRSASSLDGPRRANSEKPPASPQVTVLPVSPQTTRLPSAPIQEIVGEVRAAAKRTQWVDPGACLALHLLEREDQKRSSGNSRCALPPAVYDCLIAPYLHFDAPLADQLYAVGGRNEEQEALATVEMFDTWNGQWVTCPDMLTRRAGCAASVMADGRLMVVGGYDDMGIVEGLLSTCEVFDPAKQLWSRLPVDLLRCRWGHGCATLGSKVYTVGGCSLRPGAPAQDSFMETLRSCEVYDLADGVWAESAPLNVARAGARVVTFDDRYLAAVGGCDDVFGHAEILATVELFDSQIGKWAILDNKLSTPRTTAAVAVLDDSQIMIFGGAPSLSSGEVYKMVKPTSGETSASASGEAKPESLQASLIGGIVEGRMGCQALTLGLPSPGKSYPLCSDPCVIIVGGENGDEDWDGNTRHFSSVLVWDIAKKSWRPEGSFPDIPTSRTALALCLAPGRIEGYTA